MTPEADFLYKLMLKWKSADRDQSQFDVTDLAFTHTEREIVEICRAEGKTKVDEPLFSLPGDELQGIMIMKSAVRPYNSDQWEFAMAENAPTLHQSLKLLGNRIQLLKAGKTEPDNKPGLRFGAVGVAITAAFISSLTFACRMYREFQQSAQFPEQCSMLTTRPLVQIPGQRQHDSDLVLSPEETIEAQVDEALMDAAQFIAEFLAENGITQLEDHQEVANFIQNIMQHYFPSE